MKFRYYFLAIAGALTLGFASCDNGHVYEAATLETGNQIYFSKDLPASYNIKGLTSLSFNLNRANAAGEATVSLTSGTYIGGGLVNPSPFTIPQSVTFAAGQDTAVLQIGINSEAVAEAVDYSIEIAIAGDTTLYGKTKYNFVASIPLSLISFGKGHVTQVAWEEDYDTELFYVETEYPNIVKCTLPGAWKTFDDGGNVILERDYEFYWNQETNNLIVGPNKHGYDTGGDGLLYVSDAAGFYNLYQSMGHEYPSEDYFNWAPRFNTANGFFQPYYDGNGGFYLGDWYYLVLDGVATGRGYQFGGDPDYFIANGFVRTVDYNDDAHFGASKPGYTGIAQSMFFSGDGEPLPFETGLRYAEWDESDPEVTTTVYYLKDYFAEGYCLAFTAPVLTLLSEEEGEISDVENEQFTGVEMFGNPLYVTVKKGSIYMVPNGLDTFPELNVTLKVYSKDADGNVVYDFGTVEETFTAMDYMKDNFTLEDLYGAYYEDYLGDWTVTSTDFSDGQQYSYDAQILPGGENIFKIVNLSGLGGYFADTLVAAYDPSQGIIDIQPQKMNAEYGGEQLEALLLDPDAGKIYSGAEMYGGVTADGGFAFVNIYSDANICGFYYRTVESQSGLTGFYYVFGYPAASSAATKMVKKRTEYVTAPLGGQNISSSVKFPKVSNAPAVNKTFSLQPVENSRSQKPELISCPAAL